VLSGNTHRSPRELLQILGRARFFGFLLGFECLGFALEPLGQLARLEFRWGTIEDIQRFDTVVTYPDGAIEHPHQM
jgi:hypothetical protein